MVLYKNPLYLQHSIHQAFDEFQQPGAETPYSGIYRCAGCGMCITSVTSHPLPPEGHHHHDAAQGQIRWQLVATHT